jgi:hypothetical protein
MPLLTVPESSWEFAGDPDFLTGLEEGVVEDEDEEDCAGACAQSAGSASTIAAQLQR